MLAKKRAQGPGGSKALIIAVRKDSSGVRIPEPLRATPHPVAVFVVQHQFWDIEDAEDCFKVTLAFHGVQEELTIPYDALSDFFERADLNETEKDAPFSSADIPLEAEAIRSALAEKAAMGPGDELAIQLRGAADRCTFDPKPLSTLSGPHLDLIIDCNYWNLVPLDDHFEIVVLDGLQRVHVSVPYDAVEEGFAFSLVGEAGVARLGREVTTLTKEEMGGVEFSLSDKLEKLLAGVKPSLALGIMLTALVWALISPVLIYLASAQHQIPANKILFFAYLSPDILAALKTGYVPVATLLSDLPLLAGLVALWATTLAITALAVALPMHDHKPMHMQAGIAGFFYAYVVTLLIYGGFTISYRYVPGILRILWIVLLFGLGERLKRAYPPNSMGAMYFPQVVDGLFAIAASLIIAQGIDKTYDQALSGAAFVLIYFAIMLLFGRRLVRALLMRQLVRSFMVADDIEIPSGEVSRISQATTAAKGIFGQFRRKRERLVLLSYEELVAEYKKEFGGNDRERLRLANYRWKDAEPPLVGGIFALMLVWSGCVLFALWAATNLNLYILGVGR
ncbi:ClpXP protease specificity-enhancing factor SspB [Sphingomonas alpina]|uniref:Uncharacterized protein n=1 Tax=Sphingomonas alpina TaxID=653931 RepID=A0A7H0LM38_9SPHN|nr:ClpXP protease specificity-enhancing factor SspB [Sphingomonas alpina]QNQ10741.1 hypothetical protein H3Z74_05980 [Sphingomonas alpina]